MDETSCMEGNETWKENFCKLLECKHIREELEGENRHIQQSKAIPYVFEGVYYYHRECYQKFKYARGLMKRKINQVGVTQKEGESRGESRVLRATTSMSDVKDSRGRFPNRCMNCKKETLKVKGSLTPK